MSTTTKLISSNAFYGYEDYTNSAAAHMYVGAENSSTRYDYKSRATFPSLYTQLDIGESRIGITNMTLHLSRDSGGPTDVTVGCSGSSGWSAKLDAKATGRVGGTDGWYTVDITSFAAAVEGYQSNWFIHISGGTPRLRLNGTGRSTRPYITVTWEYVAATITGDKSSVPLGQKVKFSITPEVSGETHTLTYELGDARGTIASKKGNTIEWTPPKSLATQTPSDDSAAVRINMTAYDAAGKVQRTELYYQTVTVPPDVKPAVTSVGASLVSGLSGYGLSGRSKISIAPVIDMNGAYGAEIESVTATVTGGQSVKWTGYTESGAGVYELAAAATGAVSATGTVTVKVTATDSRGRTASGDQTFTFCAYSIPKISAFSVERYEPVYDSNEELSGYAASDLGGNVWVNISASVSKVAPDGTQLNRLKWTITGTNEATGETVTASGTGAQSVAVSKDRTAFPDPVGGDEAWSYALTVTDTAGGRTVQYSTVAVAHAVFSVPPDKRGFAVGMLSGGTKVRPLFEVAKDYESHFYGGIYGADGHRLDRKDRARLTGSDGGGVQLFNIADRKNAAIAVDKDDWISVSYDNTGGTAVAYVTVYTPVSERIREGKTYTVVLEVKSISGGRVYAVHNSTSSNVGQFADNVSANSAGTHIAQSTARSDFTGSSTMLRTLYQMPVGESGSAVFRISVLEDTTVTEDSFSYIGSFNADFAAYSEALAPYITRVGPTVFLDGFVMNTADLEAGFAGTLVVLPEWARPATDVSVIQQGSGEAIWWLRIYTDGSVGVGRYRKGAEYVDAAAGRQFPLTARWIAADAY